MLDAMDNLRKPKYPWCSDSTHYISNSLWRNRSNLILIAANLWYRLNLFSPVMFFDLLYGQDSENHLGMAGHFTIKVHDSTYLAMPNFFGWQSHQQIANEIAWKENLIKLDGDSHKEFL